MKKNNTTDNCSKIYNKTFIIIFSASIFILFFMLFLLPGCSLLFFPLKTDLKNITAARFSRIWEEPLNEVNTLENFSIGMGGCTAGSFNSKKDTDQKLDDGPPTNLQSLSGKNAIAFKDQILSEKNSICLAAISSFYDDVEGLVKLFKYKSSQDNIEQAESSQSPSKEKEPDKVVAGSPSDTAEKPAGFELELLSLINSARSSNGLAPLALNSGLNSIAKSRCDDMIARDYFSHVTPEGKDLKIILAENGIMYKTMGENLQYCFPPSNAGSGLFFNSWMDSDMHRANILGSGYTQIGIAISANSSKAIAALVFLG